MTTKNKSKPGKNHCIPGASAGKDPDTGIRKDDAKSELKKVTDCLYFEAKKATDELITKINASREEFHDHLKSIIDKCNNDIKKISSDTDIKINKIEDKPSSIDKKLKNRNVEGNNTAEASEKGSPAVKNPQNDTKLVTHAGIFMYASTEQAETIATLTKEPYEVIDGGNAMDLMECFSKYASQENVTKDADSKAKTIFVLRKYSMRVETDTKMAINSAKLGKKDGIGTNACVAVVLFHNVEGSTSIEDVRLTGYKHDGAKHTFHIPYEQAETNDIPF